MSFFDAIDTLGAFIDSGGEVPSVTVEQVEHARRWVIDRVDGSVIYHQYIRHTARGSGSNNRNTLPWHAEGERLYAAALMASVGMPGGATMEPAHSGGDAAQQAFAVCTAIWVLGASVYLWKADIEDLADSTPLPKHVVSRDAMPHPIMFWSRDVARISDATGEENNWLFLMHTPHGIRSFGDFCNPQEGTVRLLAGDLEYGRTYPDDFPDIRGVANTLGRLAFLNSPYISPEPGRLPRAWRREMQREGASEHALNPTINVVQLRRDAQENVERQRQDLAQTGERRSHWWVSGHMRSQWYPSKEAHEVIWIAPYLKGSFDKPLLKKVYKVVR